VEVSIHQNMLKSSFENSAFGNQYFAYLVNAQPNAEQNVIVVISQKFT